jgi:hypothetical protein
MGYQESILFEDHRPGDEMAKQSVTEQGVATADRRSRSSASARIAATANHPTTHHRTFLLVRPFALEFI